MAPRQWQSGSNVFIGPYNRCRRPTVQSLCHERGRPGRAHGSNHEDPAQYHQEGQRQNDRTAGAVGEPVDRRASLPRLAGKG